MSGRSSRAGSVTGARQPTPSASRSGSPAPGAAKPAPLGYDPAKPKPLTAAQRLGKRVDLPAEAYKDKNKSDVQFQARPGYNTVGKPIQMGLNLFAVNSFSDQDIILYDVDVRPNERESQALVKKVWNHKAAVGERNKKGGKWLFDGNKLAWSSKKIDRGEIRISVNLDEDKPEPKKVGRNSTYTLQVRQTKVIRLNYMKSYLEGKITWDNHVLECMNFFDHCMRQSPSEKWISIKRNFYDPDFRVGMLAYDIVVNQGIYLAPRLSDSIARGGTGLAINVDRCQTAFWPPDRLDVIAKNVVVSQNEDWSRLKDMAIFNMLKPLAITQKGATTYTPSEAFRYLRRITKLKFVVNHRGKIGDPKVYTVKRVIFDPEFGPQGATAFNVTFDRKMPDGTTKKTTIAEYYQERYGCRLQFPYLPVIESSRGGLFPLECCNAIPHQRYNFKLNPAQTSDMIKRAATRPAKRLADITEGVNKLKWAQDPCLKAFGINVNTGMTVSNARLLKNPEVAFGNQKINPGMSGRWDLRGKKFLELNATALSSWAFICCGDDGKTCNPNELENFARQFSNSYRTHGGNVAKPAFVTTLGYGDGNFSTICETAFEMTKAHFGGQPPQIIFFVLKSKNQQVYERIKRSMDCRFRIVSQCLWGEHVRKAQPQYMSNVAMKVNSKLGGVTCRVPGSNPNAPPFWKTPTMVIGLDVSHGGSGSQAPSMAALTMSTDKFGTRYAASCETNGYRMEIVQKWSMERMLPDLLRYWRFKNGVFPQHVYYIRDGVSEGQFADVLREEVKDMKEIMTNINFPIPKFTVIIATKRHHVRFFPKPNDKMTGDRNGNPLPGTLVERDVTHPKHYDFYLCSHVAIQGTARPVHYQVIKDEANLKPDELQKMIYEQCYQYCRSTTPVSLHPAVYYSHLASNRARAHENNNPEQNMSNYGKKGFPLTKGFEHTDMTDTASKNSDERKNSTPLIEMGKQLSVSMWYV